MMKYSGSLIISQRLVSLEVSTSVCTSRTHERYLEDVIAHKQTIPFRCFCGGVGQLKNAESNAETKSLDVDKLYVSHIQVNKAQKQRRRTYRARGRINPYMSSPYHIELVFAEKEALVKKRRSFQESGLKRVKHASAVALPLKIFDIICSI
ncbi:hypothetical protein L7F22_035663 [Adiantum nelumboides]|nr:hypothetical protein [Adiantum nelumboides]